ncbi:MAG: methylated-DNA--[protein]-cysteine S-methyltransferase [Burkholderiaceae bacterium]|nr:methylated-DNA--[protein]-cysteine S-methyltransferase [Rhodoferax sp.]MCP5283653.1 methylated-DNA--[protein]-cysteine S-methyltransferase [Burkholderiaceae bacterium]
MSLPQGLIARTLLPSPLGPLTAAATAKGLALLWFDGPPLDDVPEAPDQPWLAQAANELARYWLQPQTPFSVPLDLQGTAFQQSVWQALTTIGPGRTCAYADIARQIGRPAAVRAVGAANGANPVALIVPCHRVIGANGTLTGYAAGVERKAALLRHEAAQADWLASA